MHVWQLRGLLMFATRNYQPIEIINAQSVSLRSLVAAESKAAEINAVVARFESVCQL